MRIALINGSPKRKDSSSGILLEALKECLAGREEMAELSFRLDTVAEEECRELERAEAWVFACPLYVDGIPGHLLSCFRQLEQVYRQRRDKERIHVFGIVNCGFYEGIQAEPALRIMENWCRKAGFQWCGGIGVGGGGGLAMMGKGAPDKGPMSPIYRSLLAMADRILNAQYQENSYVSVAFPRFLYRMAAQLGWRQMIRANGGKWKDLGEKYE